MFVILLAPACSGVFASKVLLSVGLSSLAIRYPLSVLLAYLVFFLCIKLWLIYVRPSKHGGRAGLSDWLDFADLPGPGSGGSSGRGGIPALRPGGGQFGGGGFSSPFDLRAGTVVDHGGGVGEFAPGAGKGLGDAVGKAASALGDESGFVAVVVLFVLAALVETILGSTLYDVYEAPAILSEAAFEGLLAVSLITGAKKTDSTAWVGRIFFSTWKPFVVTSIMALVTGCALNYDFPGARRLVEILGRG